MLIFNILDLFHNFKVQIKKKIFLYFLDEKSSMSYDLEESS